MVVKRHWYEINYVVLSYIYNTKNCSITKMLAKTNISYAMWKQIEPIFLDNKLIKHEVICANKPYRTYIRLTDEGEIVMTKFRDLLHSINELQRYKY